MKGIDWKWQSMDGAMTKSPLGGEKSGKNPTDRGKLGEKRSTLVDGRGVPLAVAVEGANVPDQKLVAETLDSIPIHRPEPTSHPPKIFVSTRGMPVSRSIARFVRRATCPMCRAR